MRHQIESEWIGQNARKDWLGREGSNLRMAESKSPLMPIDSMDVLTVRLTFTALHVKRLGMESE